MANNDRARDALYAIPADLPREEWVRVGMAAHAAGLDFDVFNDWSAQAGNYNERDARDTWRSFKPGKGVGAGTLFKAAAQNGWRPEGARAANSPILSPRKPQERAKPTGQGVDPTQVWERCQPATAAHPYIQQKQGLPDGLRVVPEGDHLRIAGESMAGALVLPVRRPDGSLSSLQFIAPPETAKRLKAEGRPGKLNLPGATLEGWHLVGNWFEGATCYVCEGIGQAWAAWKATGNPAVVCFGWGRVRSVATELRQTYPGARLVLVPDAGKEQEAETIARELRVGFVRMPSGLPSNSDINDLAQKDGFDVLEVLLSAAEPAPSKPRPFEVVPFDSMTAAPSPTAFVWDGFIPAGHVTLFAAHGGTGKSYVALMLAVSVALGLPLFGVPTRSGIVTFYSGEDGKQLVLERLARICAALQIPVSTLKGRLHLIDATVEDPTLFTEVTNGGRKEGATTPAFESLREVMVENGSTFLVVDNASDAFDASEIDRARVRGFVRALANIAKERDAGVLLLAHVDKGTSRKERSDTEGYSGSTAWHNSARSRLFMSRETDDTLLIQHQKFNLGRKREPLRLLWPEGGIPVADEPPGPVVQGIADRGHERALLKLIAEFTARGEYVTTATTSRTNAVKLLRHEPGFPKVKDGEVFNMLRKAERSAHLQRITYKGPDRKDRERWEVTAAGASFAGISAATAATAATTDVTAPTQSPQEPAATAATSLPRGMGGNPRTEQEGSQ